MINLKFHKIAIGHCRYGMMVWPKCDDVIGRSLLLYGEFSEQSNSIMSKYIKDKDVVIDIGANLGTTTLFFSLAVGEEGQVVAYEPQPLIAQCLSSSLILNEYFNVQVLTGVAGDSLSWTKVSSKSINDSGNFGGAKISDEGLGVPMFKVDDLQLNSCSLIKVDVEGFEWSVLKGAAKTLLKFRPVVYFEAFPCESTVLCIDWFLRRGWKCFWHFSYFYSSNNFNKNSENVFGLLGDINVLAVPVERSLLTQLPKINAPNDDWQSACSKFYV